MKSPIARGNLKSGVCNEDVHIGTIACKFDELHTVLGRDRCSPLLMIVLAGQRYAWFVFHHVPRGHQRRELLLLVET